MNEQQTANQEQQQSSPTIEFFKPYDQRFITTDTSNRGIEGSVTTHFDPNTGWLYFAQTIASGLNKTRVSNAFNLRTKEYYRFDDRDKNPEEDLELQAAITKLEPEFRRWFLSPPGNFEVKKLVELSMRVEPIGIEEILTKVNESDYILFQDNNGGLYTCCVGRIAPRRDKPMLDGVVSIYTTSNQESLEILPYNYQCKQNPRSQINSYVGSMFPSNHEYNLSKQTQRAWILPKETYDQLLSYADIGFDPSIEFPFSREEYTIGVCWDGMAFDRWGASIPSIYNSNPERYQGCTKENLCKVVDLLISRFGVESFIKSLQTLLYEHAKKLHTPLQRTTLMLAQNNAFGDVHSDIVGFNKEISILAREIIGDMHPCVEDMEKDGHGRVGQGVYNAKSLLGDYDLFEILSEKYPSVFQSLVSTIIDLPNIDQGDWYGNSVVNPLAAVKEFFPDVFTLFLQKYEGVIPPITQPSLRITDHREGAD